MEIAGIIIGIIGILASIYFGQRSNKVEKAFAKYVELEQEVTHLHATSRDFTQKVHELEELKANIYRHKHIPKSKVFTPGDKVKLIKIPQDRNWITSHAKIGMTGIVVDYGPGTYDYTVYWSEVDYEGEPVDDIPNPWQPFCVHRDSIERLG